MMEMERSSINVGAATWWRLPRHPKVAPATEVRPVTMLVASSLADSSRCTSAEARTRDQSPRACHLCNFSQHALPCAPRPCRHALKLNLSRACFLSARAAKNLFLRAPCCSTKAHISREIQSRLGAAFPDGTLDAFPMASVASSALRLAGSGGLAFHTS